jgi:hypothetical protein
MERRKHYRAQGEYVASFSGASLRGQGVILNLSVTGCRARLRLLIDVPRYEHPLYVTHAVVRWVHYLEFGVEFYKLELADQHRLHKLVLALQASRWSRVTNRRGNGR